MLQTFGFASSSGLIGGSPAFLRVLDAASRAARSDESFLLFGESGTGKGRIARLIHDLSDRSQRPYIVWSAPEASDTLGLSELCGHVKGAFTGADQDVQGLLEAAKGGTLLVDDVDKLSHKLQGALLRLLDFESFRKVGSTREIRADVRLLFTINRPLAGVVEQGHFMPDLAWRLRTLRIHVPSLRERREDLALLVEHFAGISAIKLDMRAPEFSKGAMKVILTEAWPGNLRQLEGCVKNLVFYAQESRPISSAEVLAELAVDGPSSAVGSVPSASKRTVRSSIGGDMLLKALQACQWNSTAAAPLLGIGLRTCRRRMKDLGLGSRNKKGGRPA
jgi:DNA-binding NtrC family response regulator